MKNPFKVFEGLNGTNLPSRFSTSGAVRSYLRWPKYQGVVGAWFFRRSEKPTLQSGQTAPAQSVNSGEGVCDVAVSFC